MDQNEISHWVYSSMICFWLALLGVNIGTNDSLSFGFHKWIYDCD